MPALRVQIPQVDAEGDEAASKGGKDSDKDSEKDLVPGKYANFLSAMLDLTDAEDEASTLKDAGNVAYIAALAFTFG